MSTRAGGFGAGLFAVMFEPELYCGYDQYHKNRVLLGSGWVNDQNLFRGSPSARAAADAFVAQRPGGRGAQFSYQRRRNRSVRGPQQPAATTPVVFSAVQAAAGLN